MSAYRYYKYMGRDIVYILLFIEILYFPLLCCTYVYIVTATEFISTSYFILCCLSLVSLHKIFSQNLSSIKCFHKILLCGSFEISLSTDRDVGRGKTAYIWNFLDPVKVGPSLAGSGVVFVVTITNP